MTTMPLRDEDWGSIADMPEEARRAALRQMMEVLAKLPEEERQARLKKQSAIEYSLPDEKLRNIIVSRIHVWMDIDVAIARPVATSLDKVMSQTSSTIAMKRVGIVQTVAKDFPADQQIKLRDLVPSAFPQEAAKSVSIAARLRDDTAAATASGVETKPEKKPFWKFW